MKFGVCRNLTTFQPVTSEVLQSHVIQRLDPSIPMSATMAADATVVVHLFVNRHGSVVCAKASRRPYAFFVLPSLKAAMQWKFKPLLEEGVPRPFQCDIVFHIKL
jgi:hypothetical protein